MQRTVDKDLVRQRFSRCLATYDANATVQRRMAERLTALLNSNCGAAWGSVLEVGSGTGILTRLLLESMQIRSLWTNDIVPACHAGIEELGKAFPDTTTRFLPGDIEACTDLPSGLDLIVSNAALQWIQDLPRLLQRLVARLNPGGVLAFGTFGPDNLREISAAGGGTLHYHDVESLAGMLPEGQEVLTLEEEKVQLEFRSPRQVLEHIRATGTNGLSRTQWTRSSLARFERELSSATDEGGAIRLTYHPILVIARFRSGTARRQGGNAP